MLYGIRVVTIHWGCKDGGDDVTGTKEEMTALIEQWNKENTERGATPGMSAHYDVIPYKGEDGKPPPAPVKRWPDNPRNCTMK